MSRRIYFNDDTVLRNTIRKAFELSKPQGMGWYQYDPSHTITDDEIDTWVQKNGDWRLALDYVKGRAVKLCIYYDDVVHQRPYIIDDGGWFDHSDADWKELLAVAEVQS